MRKMLKYLGIMLLLAGLIFCCSKENDPTDDNLFVGTYNGRVTYTDTEANTDISTDDGRVTLVKVGDSYNFDFSDGIPSLKGVKMKKNQNILVNTAGTIKIDEGNLTIAYSEGEETWGANGTR